MTETKEAIDAAVTKLAVACFLHDVTMTDYLALNCDGLIRLAVDFGLTQNESNFAWSELMRRWEVKQRAADAWLGSKPSYVS